MESVPTLWAERRNGFLAGMTTHPARRFTRPAAWILPLLLLCNPCGAGLPVSLQGGRLVTASPGAEVMLGEAYWFWEGASSRVTIEQHGDVLSVIFHLDVANTAYWVDLQICQSSDGIAVIGSHSSGMWPDVCEAYASWDDLLRHQDEPLAQIAVCCLARCGMNSRFGAGETATAVLTK